MDIISKEVEKECAQSRKSRFLSGVDVALILLYLSLVISTLLTKRPWIDEAWVANPVWNLLENGRFATSFFEESNEGPLKTFSEHTYWMPPVWFMCDAVWFKLWGVGIIQQRALSAVFGGVTLVALYVLTLKLTGNRRCSQLAFLLLCVDFLFLNHAADGRMDMMVAACTFSAYALFLGLREKSLPWALLASNTAVAIGGLTNPIGIIGALGLLYLILLRDWRNLSIKLVLIASIPYVVGGLLWGAFIMRAPDAFAHQFFGKTPPPDLALHEAIYREVVERYFRAYGITTSFTIGSWSALIVGFVYCVAALWTVVNFLLKRDTAFRIIGGLICVEFLGMSVLISLKSDYHLPQILPLLAASLALFLLHLSKSGVLGRYAAVCLGGGIVLLQLRTDFKKIELNPYGRDFAPVIDLVRGRDSSSTVFAPPEVAFAMGFPDWITYDIAFGGLSGKKPGILVLHENQRSADDMVSPVYPETRGHIQSLLEGMQLVLENPSYRVFKRKD